MAVPQQVDRQQQAQHRRGTDNHLLAGSVNNAMHRGHESQQREQDVSMAIRINLRQRHRAGDDWWAAGGTSGWASWLLHLAAGMAGRDILNFVLLVLVLLDAVLASSFWAVLEFPCRRLEGAQSQRQSLLDRWPLPQCHPAENQTADRHGSRQPSNFLLSTFIAHL